MPVDVEGCFLFPVKVLLFSFALSSVDSKVESPVALDELDELHISLSRSFKAFFNSVTSGFASLLVHLLKT